MLNIEERVARLEALEENQRNKKEQIPDWAIDLDEVIDDFYDVMNRVTLLEIALVKKKEKNEKKAKKRAKKKKAKPKKSKKKSKKSIR